MKKVTKSSTFSKPTKRWAIDALFLPLVWFLPIVTWAHTSTSDTTLASEMHRFGQRSQISAQAIPEEIFYQVQSIEKDNDCHLEYMSRVGLGDPSQFAGHELVFSCPDSPDPYVAVYFNSKAKYLNSIPIGSD